MFTTLHPSIPFHSAIWPSLLLAFLWAGKWATWKTFLIFLYNLVLNIYLAGKKPIARQEPIPRIFYSRVLSLLDWPEGGDCEVDWRSEIVDLERLHEDDAVRVEHYQPLHQLWSMSGKG